ncbi:type II secretion system protein N [Kordiimonas sp.]|uniref:type II secretion system protein N n=1 Tax=Kordiimonas sp. TaxID=1970157 RepID=UPI003A9358BD
MLSLKQLLVIFVVAFFVLLVALMPARAVVGWLGLDGYVTFERVSGGLFHARLEGVQARGVALGTVEITPDIGALLTGGFEGLVTLNGMGRNGRAQVSSVSASRAMFTDISLITPLALAHSAWPLSGDVALTARSLTLDAGQGCVDGSFDVRTDMFTPAFRAFSGQDLILEGAGGCEAGHISANLEGQNEGVALKVDLTLSPQGTLVADLVLELKASLADQQTLQTLMNFAGLQRQNDGKWHGRFEAPVTF